MQRLSLGLAIVILLGCGSTPAAEPAPGPPTTIAAPTIGADGWTHYALGDRWPAPPEAPSQSTPITAGPAPLVAYGETARALGVPDGRGCTLHEVDLVIREVHRADRTERVRRMVLPGSDAAQRFAIEDHLVVPIAAMGPEIPLAAACTEELDALEAGGVDPARCPLIDAWPALDAALVNRYATLATTEAQEAYAAQLRRDALRYAVLTSYERSDDANARRALDALHALDGRDLTPGVPMTLTLETPIRATPDHGVLDQIAARLAAPASAEPADPGEAVLASLGDVALDLADTDEAFRAEPHVHRALAMGERVVPALLPGLDDTTTLSRSLEVTGEFERVSLVARREVVATVIATILDVDLYAEPRFAATLAASASNRVSARCDLVRAYWEAQHDRSAVDRRWATLGDTTQAPRAWADSALWLVSRAPRVRDGESMSLPFPDDSGSGPIQGEPLRTRTDLGETVRARLLARLDAIIGDGDQYAMESSSCVIALSLVRWDPSARSEIDDRFELLASRSSECVPYMLRGATDPGPFARYVQGSTQAFRGSVDSAPEAWAPVIHDMLQLPRSRAALERLYGPSSVPTDIEALPSTAVRFARLGVPSARTYLLRTLADETTCGRLIARGDDGWLETEGMGLMAPGRVDAPRDVSVREYVAANLAYSLELPFRLTAPPETREAQLVTIVDAITALVPGPPIH